jgi:hypothetical protein
MSELSDTIKNFSTMFDNPVIGGGPTINSKDAHELLGIFAALGDSGEDPADFVALIQALADGGRRPTRVEWAALRGEATVVKEEPVEEEPVVAQAETEEEQVPETGEAEASGDEPTSEETQPE